MKRERPDFWRWMPTLRDAYFHAAIFGAHRLLVPCLAHALEVSYMAGALDVLGLAQGYNDDDVRGRCLALQRQAAERLGELRESRDDYGQNTPLNRANRTVKRRIRQRERRFK
jgi:hypothetical protein